MNKLGLFSYHAYIIIIMICNKVKQTCVNQSKL